MQNTLFGKARLVTLVALLGFSTLSTAQSVRTAQADGFDKVEADGASLLAPVKTFKALSNDRSYHATLARWSKDTGWQLSWELGSEYAFDFEANFGGDFLKAVDGICANLNSSGVPARALAYEGNKVIRIVAEGAKQ